MNRVSSLARFARHLQGRRLQKWRGFLHLGDTNDRFDGLCIPRRSYGLSTSLLKSTQVIVDAGFEDDRLIEEQYSKKTPIEHVLIRPGMYVGPVERQPPTRCWVLDSTPTYDSNDPMATESKESVPLRMVRREYGMVPALIKIFDEILVNASDNRLRNPKTSSRIDVIIDPGNVEDGRPPFISVRNDGKGVPIKVSP